MDESREDSELEPELPVAGEQAPTDEGPGDRPGLEEASPDEAQSDEAQLPGSPHQRRPAFDFELGSEWFDPQSLFQAIASSAKASAPAGQDTGGNAEPLAEASVTPDVPEPPSGSILESPPTDSSAPALPAIAGSEEPVNGAGSAQAADLGTDRLESAAPVRELPEAEGPTEEAAEQPPPNRQENPAREQGPLPNEQESLPEPGELASEPVAATAHWAEASEIVADDLWRTSLPMVREGDNGEATFQSAPPFGEPIAPERGGSTFPDRAPTAPSASAMPPLAIEVVPSRWEQMLGDLADQAAERVAKLTSEEIDSELNLYHHQLHAQFRALMR